MRKYRISKDLGEMDIDVIHGFICQSYWAKNMPKSVLQKRWLIHFALVCLPMLMNKWVLRV